MSKCTCLTFIQCNYCVMRVEKYTQMRKEIQQKTVC